MPNLDCHTKGLNHDFNSNNHEDKGQNKTKLKSQPQTEKLSLSSMLRS